MALKQLLTENVCLSPWSIAIGSVLALLLAACGGDSGNNGKQEETSTEIKVDSLPKVETFDDLPSCSKSREDSIMVTSDENVAYRCIKGRWVTLGESYETEDDLPNCSLNRNGLKAYVLDGKGEFVCEDGIWDEIPHGETFDRSSDDEDAIVEEDENSGKHGSENGNSEDDDGENNDGDGGSSNSVDNGDDDIIQSASSEQTAQTECGEVAYTKRVAGPHTFYGYFGYVLPLKVTTGKTQELYLAFNAPTHIYGPPTDWNKFGVLIAQYNSKDSVWVQGTEIFSNDEKNASPKFEDPECGGCAVVNTYGRFEKFEFNIKGTWLEKYAGKTVDVVVNFYAPGIESEISGMGLDYYSIPDEEDFSRDGLYYSEKEPDCSFIGSPTISCINAYTYNYKPIIKGDTVRWTMQVSYKWGALQFNISNYSVESLAGKVVKENLGFVSYIDVVYDKQGKYKERLILDYNDGVNDGIKGECYNSEGWYPSRSRDSIEVISDVNNCTCTASSESLDATTAGSFTLTAKNCTSESPIVDYFFGNMVCRETSSGTSCEDYALNNAVNVSESSISVSYAAGIRAVYNPFVTVTNREGVSSRVDCPTIEVQPSSSSSSGITSSLISPNSGAIRIPKGTWPVEFFIPNWSMCHVALSCTTSGYPAENSEVEMVLDGKTITDVVPSGSYKEIDLTEKLVCPSSTAGTITVSKDVSCSLTGW